MRVIVSRSFLEEVRRSAQLERLPPTEKLPLISSAQDTVFKLDNVLNSQGLLLTNFGHPNPPDVGILTGNAAAAYVTVTGGALSADETLRIQVILDLHDSSLSFNLLDMTEGGKAGAAVKVTANGPITLSGFSDSALTSLNLSVNNFADLVKMIRSNYSGRLVDVLAMKQGS